VCITLSPELKAIYFLPIPRSGDMRLLAAVWPATPLARPALVDTTGGLFEAYDAGGGATYLLRPDAHVAACNRTVSKASAADLVVRVPAAADPP
jgi:hypothetical protein